MLYHNRSGLHPGARSTVSRHFRAHGPALIAALACFFLGPAVAHCAEVTLTGEATQGGLLIGRTAVGNTVEWQGRNLRVSPDGVFLVGFGRDAKPRSSIVVVDKEGAGQTITVDVARRDYRIQHIEGLPQEKVTPPPAVSERIRSEGARVAAARSRDDPRTDFANGFIWPLEGRITGVYGSQRVLNGEPRRPHFGVDVAAPVGTPVMAPADAVISFADPDLYFSGGTLIMDHGHGLSSTFIHLSRILVEEGQEVRQGEPVAEVGMTGRATGPHLDWRMNLFDVRLDPQLLAPPTAADSD